MASNKKGCHIRTRIPTSTYKFKWTLEHFSKLPIENTVTSPDFYPLSSNSWCSTLQKSSSYITWSMNNQSGQDIFVEHSVSIVDSSGKIWLKKKTSKKYNRHNNQFTLVSSSDDIPTSELYSLVKDVVTFSCFMTFIGHEFDTKTFELKPEDVDTSKNLTKLSDDMKLMYGVSLYTDVCLRVGGDNLRVHKAVLCARSPVFAKMFEHKLEEKETNSIDITDMDVGVLKDLIAFLYTAVVPNEDFDSILSLYYAADKYDVKDLRSLCGQILLSEMTVDNSCQILALAERHCDSSLKNAVMDFLDIFLEPIMTTDGWSDLVKNETVLAAEVMKTRAESKQKQNESERLIQVESSFSGVNESAATKNDCFYAESHCVEISNVARSKVRRR